MALKVYNWYISRYCSTSKVPEWSKFCENSCRDTVRYKPSKKRKKFLRVIFILQSTVIDGKVFKSRVKSAADCDDLGQQVMEVRVEKRGFQRRLLDEENVSESKGSVLFQPDFFKVF